MSQLSTQRENGHGADVRAELDAPTEASPEFGTLRHHGVALTQGAYWQDDEGNHVFRSLEFDVRGEGSSKNEAFEQFTQNVEDLVVYLGEVGADLTDHEREEFIVLAERFLQAWKRHDQENTRIVQVNWPWRRTRLHGRNWQLIPANSSTALPV